MIPGRSAAYIPDFTAHQGADIAGHVRRLLIRLLFCLVRTQPARLHRQVSLRDYAASRTQRRFTLRRIPYEDSE